MHQIRNLASLGNPEQARTTILGQELAVGVHHWLVCDALEKFPRVLDTPPRLVRHVPARCRCCGEALDGAREAGAERRQVTEIPQVRPVVTEHQAVELECGGCGQVTKGEFPDGVTAPVQYGPRLMGTGVYLWHGQFPVAGPGQALGELFGCAPSPGALASAARKAARLVAPAVKTITAALVRAEVAHFDESGFRTAGKLFWVHSASSGRWVLVTVHPKRGKDGMEAAGCCPPSPGSRSTTRGSPTTP